MTIWDACLCTTVVAICLSLIGNINASESVKQIVQNELNQTLFEVLYSTGIAFSNLHNQNNANSTLKFMTGQDFQQIEKINLSHWKIHLFNSRSMDIVINDHNSNVTEYSFTWNSPGYIQEVCFYYGFENGAFWYNGYQSRDQNWPMNTEKEQPRQQFNYLFDYDRYFDKSLEKEAILILEHLFVNSDGFALLIDPHQPLYIQRKLDRFDDSHKKPQLCFSVDDTKFPYYKQNSSSSLKFTVFAASNMRTVIDHVVHHSGLIPRPTKLPNMDMIENPSWLMWEFNYGSIGDRETRAMANEIINNEIVPKSKLIMNAVNSMNLEGFSHVTAFPNLTLTTLLHSHNLEVGLQIASTVLHTDEADLCRKYCVNTTLSKQLDFSIEDARKLYSAKLTYLKFEKQLDIFLVTGDVIYKNLNLNDIFVRKYPSLLTTRYVEALAQADATIVSEYAFKTQHLPVWTRLTNYVHTPFDQLLVQLIPSILSASIAGYSFVIPYSIGGLSYLYKPNEETFIRMLQATALMPVMAFSQRPWSPKYSNQSMELTKKYVDLHSKYVPLMLELANKRIADGSPIIRPMWYAAPDDQNTFVIDDQFMLGDDILVAPVIQVGQRERNVYLPAGNWVDHNQKQYNGTADYVIAVPLEELLYFRRKN